MPAYGRPWRVSTSNDRPDIALASSEGDLFAHAGTAVAAWDYNWAQIETDATAADGAAAANVRLETTAHVASYAGAGGIGYFTANATIIVYAEEQGPRVQSVHEINKWTIVIGVPGNSQPDEPFELVNPPLYFERPSSAPGAVTIGVRVEARSAGGGLGGASADIRTHVEDLTVEWLWR